MSGATSPARALLAHAQVQARRLVCWRELRWPSLVFAAATAACLTADAGPDLASTAAVELYGWLGLGAAALGGLFIGASALRSDADVGALDLFLLRPGGRWAVPLGRGVAVWVVAGALCAGGALAMGVALRLAGVPLGVPQAGLAALVVGLAGGLYGLVAFAIAAWVERATWAGLVYLVVFDTGLAAGVDSLGRWTVGTPARALLDSALSETSWQAAPAESPALLLGRLAVLALVLAAVATLRFAGPLDISDR